MEGSSEARGQVATCSVCQREFTPKNAYQLQERDGQRIAFCSARCQLKAMTASNEVGCSVCGKSFVPEYAFQSGVFDGKRYNFCSMDCRNAASEKPASIQRLAVYNLKGGTGKTTTAVSVAGALALQGLKVLLVDADPQGSVSVSLGVKAKRGLYQVLVLGVNPQGCVVNARENLDVLLSDRTLASAEIFLASRPERHRVMRDRLSSLTGYDLMVIDCSPSVGLLSQNALRCADSVLIPVSCDYLGVVGMHQAVKTMQELEGRTGHRIKLVGVLPTFHDGRLKVCREAMETLQKYYGESVLPPVRVNSKLREAPATKRTIFEHAPRSTGSADYVYLAEWIMKEHMSRTPKPRETGLEVEDSFEPAEPE